MKSGGLCLPSTRRRLLEPATKSLRGLVERRQDAEVSFIQQELVSREFVSSVQSLCSNLHTASPLGGSSYKSVLSTDGTSESGRIATKVCRELYGDSCARSVPNSEHR
jgi:hypothetical protein